MAKKQAPPPRWLRSAEAADILGVESKTIGRWAREGKIPYQYTIGNHRRFLESDIRQLLAAQTVEATDPPDLS